MATTIGQKIRAMVGDSFGADVVEQNILKAVKEVRDGAAAPESQFYDPLSMFLGYGSWMYRQGGSQLTYKDMRGMAKNPIIASIIQTRLNQVSMFASPARNKYDLGFKITSEIPAAQKDIKRIAELTNWVHTCGTTGYGETTFEQFMRKFVRDSLVMDQACAEIIYKRNGEPAYWVAVDGATIRKLKRSLEHSGGEDKKPWYVQVFQESRIVADYTQEDMIFGIRNPHTDINYAGYGQSELEYLVRIVLALINTEKFNTSQMARGGMSKGVLVVKGDTNRVDFDNFKRDFRLAIRSAAEFWSPPILNVSKDASIDWVALDQTNRDMEYTRLFDFLVKVACGVYQISPEEVNWSISATGVSTTFESSTDGKIQASKDKGLNPLLYWLADQLTYNLIHRIDNRYRLEFVGLGLNQKADAELKSLEVKSYKTVNEVRQELGLKELEGMDQIAGVPPLTKEVLNPLEEGMNVPAPAEAKSEEDEDFDLDEDVEIE